MVYSNKKKITSFYTFNSSMLRESITFESGSSKNDDLFDTGT